MECFTSYKTTRASAREWIWTTDLPAVLRQGALISELLGRMCSSGGEWAVFFSFIHQTFRRSNQVYNVGGIRNAQSWIWTNNARLRWAFYQLNYLCVARDIRTVPWLKLLYFLCVGSRLLESDGRIRTYILFNSMPNHLDHYHFPNQSGIYPAGFMVCPYGFGSKTN